MSEPNDRSDVADKLVELGTLQKVSNESLKDVNKSLVSGAERFSRIETRLDNLEGGHTKAATKAGGWAIPFAMTYYHLWLISTEKPRE